MRRLILGFALWGLGVLVLPTPSSAVFVNTFTVDSTADDGDLIPGDCLCITAMAECPLRAAIDEANTCSDINIYINFALTGGGPYTFVPATSYAILRPNVVIDGVSQASSTCLDPWDGTPSTFEIIIDGTAIGSNQGTIKPQADNITIRGVELINANASNASGIFCAGATRMHVECVYAHDNARGIQDNGQCPYSLIEKSIFSGNSGEGIDACGFGTVILNNFIGTDPTGMSADPNNAGVFCGNSAANVLVSKNLISGNTSDGISRVSMTGSYVYNYIGVDVTGMAALPNGRFGILVDPYLFPIIGVATGGGGNVISANGDYGVQLDSGSLQSIIGNNNIGANAQGTPSLCNFSGAGDINDNSNGKAILFNNVVCPTPTPLPPGCCGSIGDISCVGNELGVPPLPQVITGPEACATLQAAFDLTPQPTPYYANECNPSSAMGDLSGVCGPVVPTATPTNTAAPATPTPTPGGIGACTPLSLILNDPVSTDYKVWARELVRRLRLAPFSECRP